MENEIKKMEDIISHEHKCRLLFNTSTRKLEFVCWLCGKIVE